MSENKQHGKDGRREMSNGTWGTWMSKHSAKENTLAFLSERNCIISCRTRQLTSPPKNVCGRSTTQLKATVYQKAVSICTGNSLASLPLSFNTTFVHFKLQKWALLCCFRNKTSQGTGTIITAVNNSHSFKTLLHGDTRVQHVKVWKPSN